MTENKRFKLGYVCGDWGLIDKGVWIDLHSMSENSEKNVQICINKMNALAEENEQLKSELQKIYEIATINKVRDIVDEIYDDLLYETSDESDYARKKVLKCLEKIDLLRDDLE